MRHAAHRSAAQLIVRHLATHRSTVPAVNRLNRVLEEYPGYSFATYLTSSVGTFGIAYVALSAIGFDAPALAVAGVVSRFTKRLRTPVDLSIAAAVAHAAPWTNTLKLGPLLTAPLAAVPATQAASPLEARIYGLVRSVEGPVNKYGAPYMLVHWASGLATVSLTTACVHHGVDVGAVLGALPFLSSATDGLAQAVSGKASCVAGAMVLNTLSLPLRLYAMSVYARPAFVSLSSWYDAELRAYRSDLRAKLRSTPDARQLVLRRPRTGLTRSS